MRLGLEGLTGTSQCTTLSTPNSQDANSQKTRTQEPLWELEVGDCLGVGSWRMGVLQMINPAGDAGRPKPVVDVHDAHSTRAAVEHSQQRRNAAEAGAIADACWYGNHRHANQPADHAGQRTLHAGHDDEY